MTKTSLWMDTFGFCEVMCCWFTSPGFVPACIVDEITWLYPASFFPLILAFQNHSFLRFCPIFWISIGEYLDDSHFKNLWELPKYFKEEPWFTVNSCVHRIWFVWSVFFSEGNPMAPSPDLTLAQVTVRTAHGGRKNCAAADAAMGKVTASEPRPLVHYVVSRR